MCILFTWLFSKFYNRIFIFYTRSVLIAHFSSNLDFSHLKITVDSLQNLEKPIQVTFVGYFVLSHAEGASVLNQEANGTDVRIVRMSP